MRSAVEARKDIDRRTMADRLCLKSRALAGCVIRFAAAGYPRRRALSTGTENKLVRHAGRRGARRMASDRKAPGVSRERKISGTAE